MHFDGFPDCQQDCCNPKIPARSNVILAGSKSRDSKAKEWN